MPSIPKRLQILAALAFREGVIAFIWLLSLPTNRQMLSASRLAGLVGILLVLSISAAALIYFREQGKDSFKIVEKVTNYRNRIPLSFLSLTVSLFLWVAVLFKAQWLSLVSESTYIRLLPVITYAVLLLLQTGIFLLIDQGNNRGPDE